MLWVRGPLQPSCLYPWARCLVSIALLTWAWYRSWEILKSNCWKGVHLVSCTLRWSETTVTISPIPRNNRQQHFESIGKRHYTNAEYYYIFDISSPIYIIVQLQPETNIPNWSQLPVSPSWLPSLTIVATKYHKVKIDRLGQSFLIFDFWHISSPILCSYSYWSLYPGNHHGN